MTAARITWLVFAALLWVLPAGVTGEELTAREVQDRFLKCHAGIKSWTLEMRVDDTDRRTDPATNQERETKRSHKITYYFDGKSMRKDWKTDWIGISGPDGPQKVVSEDGWYEERNVMTPDRCIHFIPTGSAPVDGPNKGKVRYVVITVGGFERMGGGFLDQFFQVEAIGMGATPYGILYTKSIASYREFLNAPTAVLSETIGKETMPDGHEALVLSYQFSNNRTCRYWIVPEMDYNAVRVEVNSVSENDNRLVSTSQFELKYDERSKLWFPKTVRYERIYPGIHQQEVWTISKAEFNQPVSAKLFTLEGLGIARGRTIRGLKDEQGRELTHVWDGEKAVLYPLKEEKIIE